MPGILCVKLGFVRSEMAFDECPGIRRCGQRIAVLIVLVGRVNLRDYSCEGRHWKVVCVPAAMVHCGKTPCTGTIRRRVAMRIQRRILTGESGRGQKAYVGYSVAERLRIRTAEVVYEAPVPAELEGMFPARPAVVISEIMHRDNDVVERVLEVGSANPRRITNCVCDDPLLPIP